MLLKRSISSFFLLSVLAFSLYAIPSSGSISYAAAEESNIPELFTLHPELASKITLSSSFDEHVTRVDVPITVNLDALNSDAIAITVFGETFHVTKYKINERGPDDYTWIGSIDGQTRMAPLMFSWLLMVTRF